MCYVSLRTCPSLSSLPPATMLPKQNTPLVIFKTIIVELATKGLIIGPQPLFFVHPPNLRARGVLSAVPVSGSLTYTGKRAE